VIRSLRVRVFLIVWPLVVASLVAVGLTFGRWTRVELDRITELRGDDPRVAARRAAADSIAAAWEALLSSEGGARLRRIAAAAGAGEAVVVDVAGRLVAASDSAIRPADVRVLPDGTVDLVRRVRRERALQAFAVRMSGAPVVDSGGRVLGRVYLLPRPSLDSGARGPSEASVRGVMAGAWRTIWTAVVLASLVAAAATVLLARPVVGQVGRLAHAARRIRGGELKARVVVSSGDELGELERSFNAMAEALERAETHKRRMISDVAHELRTPLTNVIGLLEAMRDGLRAPDTDTLASAREEAALLHTLIDELQELSLAEAGALRFTMETLDAVEEARRAAEASAPASSEVRIEAPRASAPIPVRADRRRLAQVLRNLLRNALTHSSSGGVVRVDVAREGGEVVIRVIDYGRGISPEHLPLVWERFYRVDPSRDRTSGGMGLGLAVARHLVEGMGGRVSAESEPGRGSTFTVALPAAEGLSAGGAQV
jgi:signal transduction histidine kinase